MTLLLEDVAADTNGAGVQSKGGPAVISIRATSYGGGTVAIQVAPPSKPTAWVALVDGVYTVDGDFKTDYLPNGMWVRAVLSGSTSPSGVTVELLQ